MIKLTITKKLSNVIGGLHNDHRFCNERNERKSTTKSPVQNQQQDTYYITLHIVCCVLQSRCVAHLTS